MRGGHRRANPGGQVDPKRCRQKRGHHGPDEYLGRAHAFGRYDALCDCRHNIAPRDQGACAFKNSGNCNGAAHAERICTHGRAHIVGHIVGANVQRHIGTKTGRNDHDHRIVGLTEEQGSNQTGHHNEDQRDARAHQGSPDVARCLFEICEPVKITVQRFKVARVALLICHIFPQRFPKAFSPSKPLVANGTLKFLTA